MCEFICNALSFKLVRSQDFDVEFIEMLVPENLIKWNEDEIMSCLEMKDVVLNLTSRKRRIEIKRNKQKGNNPVVKKSFNESWK